MKPLRSRINRALAGFALLLVAGGCIDRGALITDPVAERDLPLVRHTQAGYTLYEGDSVRVVLDRAAGAAGSGAELLVVNAAREVLWRSAEVTVRDSSVTLPVAAVPSTLFGDTTLFLTATLRVRGTRVYATDDTIAVVERERAALRPVRFFPGRVVGVRIGGPQSLALDPATGRLYFASATRAEIGVVDLAAGDRLGVFGVPSGPVALSFRAGLLAALIADGTELSIIDVATGAGSERRVLLPTLSLRVLTTVLQAMDTTPARVDTLDAIVRPFGQGLALGCTDTACERMVAFTSSDLASADSEARSAVRRLAVRGSEPVAPLLVPRFVSGLPTDTVSSSIAVFGSARSGTDSLVQARSDALRCPSVSVGDGPFDVAPGPGSLLYATTREDVEPCGAGTRLMRIDHAASTDSTFSLLARRNLIGENRIAVANEVRVSPDGVYVLVRTTVGIHLFDADLRLRATLPLTRATAVAWLQGPEARSTHFAVASAEGVVVYDTARRLPSARFPIGATRESMLALWRSGTDIVAAAAPLGRDGLVTARIPFQ